MYPQNENNVDSDFCVCDLISKKIVNVFQYCQKTSKNIYLVKSD